MKQKIKVISFLKFHLFLGVLLGLILGILYSFGGLVIDSMVSLGWIQSAETPGLSHGTLLAFGALIGMPVIFGGLGLIFGLIEVVLYKLFYRWLSHLDINFKEE